MDDLIRNPNYTPSFDEIHNWIDPPARELWGELNGFIQQEFHTAPKMTYSPCMGKPGWNIKYKKSGKAICTLYPEKNCFIALVVISVDMAPLLAGRQPPLHPHIQQLILTGKPFNGTLWLMLPIGDPTMLEGLEDLLVDKVRGMLPAARA